MALLTPQTVSANGSAVVLGAAGGSGDTVSKRDTGFLLISNPTGGSINVTLDIPQTLHGHAVASQVTAVAAGAHAIIPISDAIFEHSSDHLIHVAYSGAGLLVAAVSL